MGKESAKIPNSLRLYRRKNGLSQKDIARLLGYKSSTAVSNYEQGTKSPHLVNLLKLEIINRVPVAFLYRECYQALREDPPTGGKAAQSPRRRSEIRGDPLVGSFIVL